MKRQQGFTLVELLVVIAIISILAAIAIPAVGGFIGRSQMRSAEATVNSVDTALTGILSDATVRDFRGIFTSEFLTAMATEYGPDVSGVIDAAKLQTASSIYTDIIYQLLRQGRNADLSGTANVGTFDPGTNAVVRANVKQKLSATYIDLQKDPWGNNFSFFIGPLPRSVKMPFRSYRLDSITSEVDGVRQPLVYDATGKSEWENAEDPVPGQPAADDGVGLPADNNLAVYVWSPGEDGFSNQGYKIESQISSEKDGGGDDINNWDGGNGQKGWEMWY